MSAYVLLYIYYYYYYYYSFMCVCGSARLRLRLCRGFTWVLIALSIGTHRHILTQQLIIYKLNNTVILFNIKLTYCCQQLHKYLFELLIFNTLHMTLDVIIHQICLISEILY